MTGSLMEAGADVYGLDRYGHSAMHYAAEAVTEEIMRVLEEEEESKDSGRDSEGRTGCYRNIDGRRRTDPDFEDK